MQKDDVEYVYNKFYQDIHYKWLYEAVRSGEVEIAGFLESESIRASYRQAPLIRIRHGHLCQIKQNQEAKCTSDTDYGEYVSKMLKTYGAK